MKNKEVCALYRITPVTLCKWVKEKKIKVKILPSGRYDYIVKELKTNEKRVNVIYSRVSTSIQKENMARQSQRIQGFCSAKGVVREIVQVAMPKYCANYFTHFFYFFSVALENI